MGGGSDRDDGGNRGPRSFDESDGKYSLTLGNDTDNPLGPRLTINGDGMPFFLPRKGRSYYTN